MERLADHGMELDSPNNAVNTPLLISVSSRNRKVAAFLLEKRADISATDKLGNTPLLLAIYTKSKPPVELLLAAGTDVSYVNHAGQSPLLVACQTGNRMLINLLAEKGADMLISGKNGLFPIWYACSANQKEIVRLFLEHGVDANYSKPISGDHGQMNAYLDWVETANDISVTAGYSLNMSVGEGLLRVATKSGHLSMVKLLLDARAEINVQDENGNSPLHYAASYGKKDVVTYLLQNNADPALVNVKEQLPIDYSDIKGFNGITELLLAHKGTAPIPVNVAQPKPAKGLVSDKKKALLDLKEFMDAGILSKEEFNSEKAKILSS